MAHCSSTHTLSVQSAQCFVPMFCPICKVKELPKGIALVLLQACLSTIAFCTQSHVKQLPENVQQFITKDKMMVVVLIKNSHGHLT